MADFMDKEAVLSDDSGASHSTGDTSSDKSDNDEPVQKKPRIEKKKMKKKEKKGKKRRIVSDDEDEEDDEEDEQAKQEMEGFIVDEPVDEDEPDDKSDKSDEKSDNEDLDEDDIDLINENLDRNEGKKGRGAMIDDSDDEVDDRAAISKEIFGFPDDEDPQSSKREIEARGRAYSDDGRSGSESEGSHADDFIEYDNDERRPIRDRHKKRRDMNIPEGALDEARDIFGVDEFNFNEFYDEGDEEGGGEEDEMYDEDEMGEDGEERPRVRRVVRKEKKETLLDTMEPTDLERGYLAPQDKKIQLEDRPERFQLRKVHVMEANDEELDLESKWIFMNAFMNKPVSKQDDPSLPCMQDDQNRMEDDNRPSRAQQEMEAPEKIRETLRFLRNQLFEVPFIAFYRKEGIQDMLMINELWKVYRWDQKWCHLKQRKQKLISLMRRMQTYLIESMEGMTSLRPLVEEDFLDVENVQSMEGLADVSGQFQLFYASELNKMHAWEMQRKRELEGGEGEEGGGGYMEDLSTKYKQATRKDKYQMCVEHGIGEMAARFGLTAKQFAENLDWKRHEVEQDSMDPTTAAEEYISTSFLSPQEVINGAVFMLAKQISREPAVRQRIRECYLRRVTITVRPTAKGRETMDDGHPIYKKRYICEKPVTELEQDDYLHYHLMAEQGMLDIKLSHDKKRDLEMNMSLIDTILSEQPFHKDDFDQNAVLWNELREKVVRMAIGDLLIPSLEVEMHAKLLEEAKDSVIKRCAECVYTRLQVAPFKPPKAEDGEEEEETDVRVLGLVYSTERDEVSFGALVDEDGSVVDHIRLPYLMNKRGPNLEDKQKREDLEKLGKFVQKHMPHIIAIAGENLQARFVQSDVRDVVMRLYQDDKINRNVQVVIHENDAAKVYMQSKMAITEHPDYPPYLRQALSLARLLVDPMIEYAHLCNADEDIICLPFHPLQNEVNKEDLAEAISLELINRVNEVGVDINKCVELPHHSNVLQFVCGLGPRKATHLMKTIRQNNGLLESRTRLVTLCKIGPKVFMNCAGFIKIDTVRVSERTDSYVEVLDGSRVHPETYEWARKMAIDALEVDDNTDPTAALEDVLRSPERLKDLDLDAFAEELARQGFGNKGVTLYDIRSELFCRYKDFRCEYREPREADLFGMLTKETISTLFPGKLVTGKVERIVYKKMNRERDQQPQPIRDDRTDMWKCSLCQRKYEEVSAIFEHYDSMDPSIACPGQPIGIRIRLDNGVGGFIRNQNVSDNPSFQSPAERVRLNQPLYCRVMKVDPERFSVDLTCKSSDLTKVTDEWGEKDRFWYDEAEVEDKTRDRETAEKKKQMQNQFVKRVISHPNFHNVTYRDAERMLGKLEQGDAIIRPSSKSANNLTVTWKVADGIFQHIDIQEHEKEKPFTLGKRLVIGTEEFEDLEEILSRWIQPMAAFTRECMQHKYSLEGCTTEKKDEIEHHLIEERKGSPARIPYCFTPSALYAGKFTLNYLVRKLRQEYMTMTPEGIKFRSQMFSSLDQLVNWFKAHFREVPPSARGGYR